MVTGMLREPRLLANPPEESYDRRRPRTDARTLAKAHLVLVDDTAEELDFHRRQDGLGVPIVDQNIEPTLSASLLTLAIQRPDAD